MKNQNCSLQNVILQTLQDKSNNELIIAYSGGVDSQVLLHALVQLKQQHAINNPITACHVNHGLSDNAQSWQDFAEQQCSNYGVNLVVKRVDIKPQAQQSLEELARDARYDALNSLSSAATLILTGHHGDDQSETFLLALKRGAGLKGLSAMATSSTLKNHQLVRPLLSISRQSILDYANEHQLNWIEDESNADISFDRNFIRNKVMPLLKQRWPSISQTINRSAEHCQAGQELLDELAAQDLVNCSENNVGNSLAVSPLLTLSKARFNNLIRYFLAQHNFLMPSTEQLKQLSLQLTAGNDKTPSIKVGDHFFRRFKQSIYLTAEYEDVSGWHKQVHFVDGIAELILPDHLGKLVFSTKQQLTENTPTKLLSVSLPKQNQQVTVRFSHNNPKCLPDYRQHSRSVKKVLQELNIAPWQRKRVAFLYYGEVLVAAIGHFVCQPFMVTESEAAIHIYQG